MKNKAKGVIVILVCMLLVGMFGTSGTAATSKRAAACKAYRAFLKKNVSHFTVEEGDWNTENKEGRDKCSCFLIADMNGDGVPELITEHDNGYKSGFLNVYTYKNGKVQHIKTKKNNKVKIDITCTAAGWYTVYACNKGHLHVGWEASEVGKDYLAYNLKSGKLNRYLHGVWDELSGENHFYKNGNHITEKEFNRLYNKCKMSMKMHANTTKNRTKYVK